MYFPLDNPCMCVASVFTASTLTLHLCRCRCLMTVNLLRCTAAANVQQQSRSSSSFRAGKAAAVGDNCSVAHAAPSKALSAACGVKANPRRSCSFTYAHVPSPKALGLDALLQTPAALSTAWQQVLHLQLECSTVTQFKQRGHSPCNADHPAAAAGADDNMWLLM